MKPNQKKVNSRIKGGGGRSPHKKRQEIAILDRRCTVAEYYLQGKTQTQIAELVGVTTATILKDLDKCREEWLERAAWAFDQRKSEELAKIDWLERLATEGYMKSMEPQKITRKRRETIRVNLPANQGGGHRMEDQGIVEETIIKQQACGDPRFLQQIDRCIELRLKIFNITKGNTTQNNNTINWNMLIGPPPQVNVVESKITAPANLPSPVPNGAFTILENEPPVPITPTE